MLIPEDEKFEEYLRKFKPLAPAPLPVIEKWPQTHRGPVLGAWVVAAVTIVLAAVVMLHSRPGTDGTSGAKSAMLDAHPPKPRPLTIGTANASLAHAPSAKAAINELAAQVFQSQSIPPSKGMQSALAVLGKEKTKI